MMNADPGSAIPTALPVAQRLAAKFGAAASALADLAAGAGFADAAPAGARLAARLNALSATAQGTGPDPLDRLAAAWGLGREAQIRALVAALPVIDADAAALVAELAGGSGKAVATDLLEALFPGPGATLWAQRLDCDDPFVTSGLLRLNEGLLSAGPGFWPGVLGHPIWPASLNPRTIEAAALWCEESGETALAVAALRHGEPLVIGALDESTEAATEQALALALTADRRFVVFDLEDRDNAALAQILAHCLLRGCCPILILPASGARLTLPGPDLYPATVLVVGRDLGGLTIGHRGLIAPPAQPRWDAARQTEVWQSLVPTVPHEDLAAFLAHYPLGPLASSTVAQDAQTRARLAERGVHGGDLLAAAAARGTRLSLAAASRRDATAGWDDLVLPLPALADLRAAAQRLTLRPRAEALLPRGILPKGHRLLFTGAPGTGKTLAAEVLAHETGSTLIVAETPRLVSKWLGETERNLAELFRAAEESHAILFFDEADAIFGKRVAAHEARDRYANIETAYLLQRIERFTGLVILATNLPGNLDDAFKRRFDAIIDFPQPDAAGRSTLWRRHLPRETVAGGVDVEALAEWFTLPGGLIRNAAVSAAYLAAAEGSAITQAHLHHAIAHEYLKNGRPFPGLPDPHPTPISEEEFHYG